MKKDCSSASLKYRNFARAVGGLYDESATIDENEAFPEIPSPCGSDFEKRTEPKRKPRRPHEKRLSR